MVSKIIDEKFEEYKRNCPNVKTTIHWYNLYEGHYVTLDKDFQIDLFSKAVKKAGNYSELGRILDIGRKTISNCSRGIRNPNIRTIKKVAKYANYPTEDINNKIIKISNLKPNLPFNLSTKEGAEIRAAFLSDGHNDKSPIKCPQYCALEKESHKRLVELCKTVFGEFNAKIKWRHKIYVTKFPAVIGAALKLSGVPRGDKRLANCFLPKDIFTNRDFYSAYLRKIFDDEGDVSYRNKKRAIRLSRSTDISDYDINEEITSEKWIPYRLPNNIKHNLLIGERIILQKSGIRTNLYSEGVYKSKNGRITAKWRLIIIQQDNLRKFAELINFNLIDKQLKLKKALESYKVNERPNGEGEKHALEFLRKIYKEKGFFKYGDLGKELVKIGKSYDLAGRYMGYLIKKGIIKKIKYGTYVFE